MHQVCRHIVFIVLVSIITPGLQEAVNEKKKKIMRVTHAHTLLSSARRYDAPGGRVRSYTCRNPSGNVYVGASVGGENTNFL